MFRNEICYDYCGEYHDKIFDEGIVNGASWYSFHGSMQDWLYTDTSDFDVTIEMGCNQYPSGIDLEKYWDYNKRALISYIKEIHKGLKGTVVDSRTGLPLNNVRLKVEGVDHDVRSGPDGDYWRLLLPGSYNLQFFLDGYKPSETINVKVSTYMATILKVKLTSNDERKAKEISSSIITPTMVIVIVIVLVLAIVGLYIIRRRRNEKNQSLEMS